jgi:GTPase SAR1 family protein
MTGVEAAAAGAAFKAGVDLIFRAAPKGFAFVKSWWIGKEILIIGQARAGKTTFREYLQYDIFEDVKDTIETPDIEPSARFNLELGKNSSLGLIISTAVDIPGQVGAVAHANLAFERNPHALLIVLDLTTPLQGEPDRASAAWLMRFCRRYEARWRSNRRRKNRIKSVIIVMNKADKMDEQIIANKKQEYQNIINTELRDARGSMIQEIAIMPCSVVTNPRGKMLVDSVIRQLAISFTRS